MSAYQKDPSISPFNSPSKKGLHPHLTRSTPEREKDYSAYEDRSELLKVMQTPHPQLSDSVDEKSGFVDNIADAIKTHPILSMAGLAAIGFIAFKAASSGKDEEEEYLGDGRLSNPVHQPVVYLQNPEPKREVICFPQSQVVVRASDTPASKLSQTLTAMPVTSSAAKKSKFSPKERKRRSKQAKAQKRDKGGTFK